MNFKIHNDYDKKKKKTATTTKYTEKNETEIRTNNINSYTY
jgi:hypothetical protein